MQLFHPRSPKRLSRCVKVGYAECAAPPARSLIISPVTNNLSHSVREVSGNPTHFFLHTDIPQCIWPIMVRFYRRVCALLRNQSELIISLWQIACTLSCGFCSHFISPYMCISYICAYTIHLFHHMSCIHMMNFRPLGKSSRIMHVLFCIRMDVLGSILNLLHLE